MNKPATTPKAKAVGQLPNTDANAPNAAFDVRPDALIKAHLNATKVLSEMSLLSVQTVGKIAQKQAEMAKETSEILRQSIGSGGSTPSDNAARFHDACIEMLQASGRYASEVSDMIVTHCCDAVSRSAEMWSSSGRSEESSDG